MLIGSKKLLSMECEIVPSTGDTTLGHFCMWADNQMIGDFSDVLVLGAVEAQIERSLLFSGDRRDPELLLANKTEAARILHDALYGEGGDLEISRELSLKYGRFNLKELGISSFDGLFVFLIDCDSFQRLLWWDTHDGNIKEFQLPPLEYDRIAREYLAACSLDPKR